MYSYYEEQLKKKNMKLDLMQFYLRQAMKQEHEHERVALKIYKRKTRVQVLDEVL